MSHIWMNLQARVYEAIRFSRRRVELRHERHTEQYVVRHVWKSDGT